MYKVYNYIEHKPLAVIMSNQVEVSQYPETNLPPVELPLLDNPKELVTVNVSDIYDLFNAERLASASPDIVASIRSNMQMSSQVSDIISRMSDEQILETIKPRNLQSPSQLIMWSKHLQQLIESHLEDYNINDAHESEPTLEPPTPTPNE